jgi:mRNA interferase MazF
MINPQRGEIWLVNLDPTRGQEIQKTRPVVVISADIFSTIPIRIIVPITSWQEKFSARPFMIKISATPDNKLNRDSAGNVLQIRSLSTERFIKKIGIISQEILEELLLGLIICVDYVPQQKNNSIQ